MMSEHNVTAGQRQQMIAEAAYFRAERRGFRGGDVMRDWCEAEAEIDARLRQPTNDELLERIEKGLAAASKRTAALRRKMAGLSAEAKTEWQKDLEKLAALRDSLKPKATELRDLGEQAGHKLRAQAEHLRTELAELVQRLGAEAKR